MAGIALVKTLYRRLVPPRGRWDVFVSSLTRENLIHERERSRRDKQSLFKDAVRLVELEPHSFCNRTCSFCPNSALDRRSVKHRMDRALFDRVLEDLGSIQYAGVLRFARYSEPMADDHIYELVAVARQRLPRATIDIVTNGDYLRPDSLARLRDAGLSVLRISVYVREGISWSADEARLEIERLGRRIDVGPQLQPSTPTTVYGAFPFPGLPIEVYSHDFDQTGYDRGQLLPHLMDRAYVRHSPCSLVFTNFTVDWDGKVMPCCNLRSDEPRHAPYVVGDLSAAGTSIFDVYASETATAWRRSLASVGAKDDPCRTCKQKTVEGEALIRLGERIHRRLDRIGVAL